MVNSRLHTARNDEILIADDTEGNRLLLEKILTNAGYTVRVANGAALALRTIKAKKPTLILLDVRMPDMDGYELCRQLKSDKETSDIPVIFISASVQPKEIPTGFELGAVDFILKPFLDTEVLARVATHLTIYHIRQELKQKNDQLLAEAAERTKRELEIKESEYRFSDIFHTMEDGIVYMSPTGTVLKVNEALVQITGIPQEKLIHMTALEVVRKFLPPREIIRIVPMVINRLKGNPLIPFELEYNKKTLEIKVQLSENSRNLICVIRDISEQKKSEAINRSLLQKVQEEKERLDLLIQSMNDEVWFADTDGHFTLANPSACKAFDLENVDSLDIQAFAQRLEVFRPDGSPRPVKEAPPLRALAGETIIEQVEIVRLPKTGDLRYRQVSCSPVRNPLGVIIGCVSVVHDITDIKLAEDEIRQSETQLRQLVDVLQHPSPNMKDFLNYTLEQAILLTKSKFGYVYYSREEPVGFVLSSWSSNVMQECDTANPPLNSDLKDGFWGEAIRQRHPIVINNFQSDNPLKKGTPTGHVKILKYMTVPVFKDDKVIGVVGLANKETDYTETDILQTSLLLEAAWKVIDRLRVEEEIRSINADLEERIVQRTAELKSSNKELEAFSYSVSHDLRTPLRSIEGYSQILLNEFSSSLPEKGHEYLQRVQRNALHMGKLIDDMLMLSRLNSDQFSAKPTDLSALTFEVANDLTLNNPNRDVQVEIEPGLSASGDRSLLRIVLTNLLGNAWKFTSKLEHAHIHIGVLQDPKHGSVFFVRDNGVGFDSTYTDKLFSPFQRLHSANEYPGTGIGLATVARIIHRHNGEVWAESELGKGATFYFTLPDSVVS